ESLVYGLRSPVSLKIYDLTGRLVKSFPAYHLPLLTSISWAGTDNSGKFLPSGIYFCRLDMCNEYVVKQISILK
ncbi:MAG: hypothetical protein QMD71_09980, partial [bacterium]|nr:hypothetical protein [bacterium]